MDAKLERYLAGRTAFASETATWGDLDLEIDYYASEDLPPDHLVTSVRAVVLDTDRVLVIQDKTGSEHVVPGGRRQPGESLEDTLHREVLEETRWIIGDLSPLAVGRFHIASPVPDDYAYPHPDYLQLIYTAKALLHEHEVTVDDEWVVGCDMLPVDSLHNRKLEPSQRLILGEALNRGRKGQ